MDQENKKRTTENTLLNTDVASVFVVQNSRKRPFIEQFEHTSVNFTQKALGTMLGFFIVRDESPTSENIVNFLASEVKKQYFSPTEKPMEEKFESALHRVNRALEEIANLGNISWLGTVEGAVCVINENSIHFSVAGNAHILLLRNDTLINISEGLASEDAASYPLKTFVDVSSGDICAHDKIIIASHELLELISLDELQKNAIRMGEKNFIQFIETALTNECAIASATIIDITEKDAPTAITPQPQEEKEIPENFFGANTFEDVNGKEEDEEEKPLEEEIDIEELTEETPKEYTDPRTGHIHIQGDEELPESPTFLDELSEKLSDAKDNLKDFSQKKTKSLSKKITNLKKDKGTAEDEIEENDDVDQISTETGLDRQKIAENAKVHLLRICTISKDAAKRTTVHCTNIIAKTRDKVAESRNKKDEESQYTYTYSQEFSPKEKKNILPHFSKIKDLWGSMDNKTKLIALAVIAFMLFTPLLFSLFSGEKNDDTEQITEQETEEIKAEEQPQIEERQENTISDPTTLYRTSDALQIFVLKEVPISIEKETIHVFEDGQETYPVPDDAGNITHAAAMDDLNMIFFVTDQNKLYSFSPAAKKYSEQPNVPNIDYKNISFLSTFMTYLYVLEDKTITRHTRIEGGFDEGKDWLKEDFDFSNATSFSINDEIFTTQDSDVAKFSEGKKERYSKDNTIQNASLAYTAEDLKYVWIIDKENETLYKTKKDNGSVVDSYMHTALSAATTLAIDEEKDTAFITTSDEVSQISLKK